MNPHLKELRQKAATLPLCPGVYLMKNDKGEVIYVGKSRKLKNRVSSYFASDRHNYKTQKMVSRVADFDYILCDGEMEALTLENTLIKQYTPHYNIRLKDAKSYPYLKVTAGAYPRIVVTRDRQSDKGRYYGPYASASAAHEVSDTLARIFSLPTCKRQFPRDIGKERPCLYAQMGRCIAPCTGEVEHAHYLSLIRAAEGVLSGNIRDTEEQLTAAMMQAAEKEQYELAAHYRDAIAALGRLTEKQKVVGDSTEDRDVFALYTDETCGVLAILVIREGKLIHKNEFLFSAASLTEAEDTVSLVTSYYEGAANIPREILTDFPLDEEDVTCVEDYLTAMAGHRVYVHTPKRGKLRHLADMALTNARERARLWQSETKRRDAVSELLGNMLGLSHPPHRIEAYDISEIGTEHITAAMAVTEGTKFKNSDYRTFRMKTVTGVDDYASMRECLSRRLAHIGDGTASLGEKPDLILLDGGVGQVNAVREVMDEMGLDIPLFGMVKDDYHKTRALTDGTNEISIAAEQSVYVFIYGLQEEVHRIAVRATMGAKRGTLRRSALENITGIGPAKAKKILACMPYSKLKSATVDEMTAKGIAKGDAARVYQYFHKEES